MRFGRGAVPAPMSALPPQMFQRRSRRERSGHWQACAACAFAALILVLSPHGARAQPPSDATARQVFDSRLPTFRDQAPDELVARLRQRATALLSPLPGFDPGSRMVDIMVEQPWTALRGRCPPSATMTADTALRLADDMVKAGRAPHVTDADRGTLAALIAALDGRICKCTGQPSLSLAADCASQSQ
jgi:hypothetical protein